MTGLSDKPVAAFLTDTEVHNFIYQTRSYLELWLPMLETNNRSAFTVATVVPAGNTVRCIREQLADYFRSRGKMSSLAIARWKNAKHDRKAPVVTNKPSMHARPRHEAFRTDAGFLTPRCYYAMTKAPKREASVIALVNARLRQRASDRNSATGPQEVEALAAVIALFNSGFDEDLPSLYPISPTPSRYLMTQSPQKPGVLRPPLVPQPHPPRKICISCALPMHKNIKKTLKISVSFCLSSCPLNLCSQIFSRLAMILLIQTDSAGAGRHRKCYTHPDNARRCIKVIYNRDHGGDKEIRRELSYYAHLSAT